VQADFIVDDAARRWPPLRVTWRFFEDTFLWGVSEDARGGRHLGRPRCFSHEAPLFDEVVAGAAHSPATTDAEAEATVGVTAPPEDAAAVVDAGLPPVLLLNSAAAYTAWHQTMRNHVRWMRDFTAYLSLTAGRGDRYVLLTGWPGIVRTTATSPSLCDVRRDHRCCRCCRCCVSRAASATGAGAHAGKRERLRRVVWYRPPFVLSAAHPGSGAITMHRMLRMDAEAVSVLRQCTSDAACRQAVGPCDRDSGIDGESDEWPVAGCESQTGLLRPYSVGESGAGVPGHPQADDAAETARARASGSPSCWTRAAASRTPASRGPVARSPVVVVDATTVTLSRWEAAYDGLHYLQGGSADEDTWRGSVSGMVFHIAMHAVMPECGVV
jgi:hypothetical protein